MSNGKVTACTLGDTLTLIVVIAMALVGIGVIVGWHPHVRPLVQIVPGAAMVPVLSVGISAATQSDSEFTWSLPLFIGLFMAGLFGLAAYKLAQSRIALKGFILISVPLIFVLAFVMFVIEVKRQDEQVQTRYLQSKEVLAETEAISRSMLDAEASIRGYVITGDTSFIVAYKHAAADIPERINRLQTLVRNNPEQEAHLARIGARAAEKMDFLSGVEQLVLEGKSAQAVEQIKSGNGLRLMDNFRREFGSFLEEERQLDAARRKKVEESWQRFNWLLVAGASVDILFTMMLGALFTRGISKRVYALTENAQALAEGKELKKPMKGSDEIARLDHVFHDMVQALTEAVRKERALIENSLDVICSIDEEGRFVEVSPASYEVWGYLPEELIGKPYVDLVVPEDLEKTNQAAAKIVGGHSLTNFENRYLRKDGLTVNLMWSAFWSETEKLMYCVAHGNNERKQAEAALRESEERYRLLFDSNPYPIWVYELETLAFLAVNKAAIDRYGYSREEFLSMTIKDIRPPEDVSELLENVAQVGPSVIDQAGEWRHRKKDGEIIYVEITSHQLLLNGRKAELVLANDITERKQIEERLKKREAQLSEAQRIAHIGSWEWDIAADKVTWSDELYRIFGFQPHEFSPTYEGFMNFVHPDDREAVSSIISTALHSHEYTSFDQRIVRPDGTVRFCTSIGKVVLDDEGNPLKLMGVFQDITKRKMAENLAEEQKQELEKMAANLTATNKELEAFSYSVSHDLRAPLRAVDGFSRILLEDYADKLDAEGIRVLSIIRNNTQNMGRLIDDLLAFSRFGRKQIEPSTIDVGELARDVFIQLEPDNNKAPLLEIKQPPVAYGDRALMRQVFVNLLSNAAKYSKPAELPMIEVGGRSENGENIYYVKDNGVGFDMKYVNKLFGVFQRLHSHEEFEGTGVGLAIVRRIIERHRGRVWAEGKKGEGATFYFTLPKNGETHDGQFAQ